ncbi:hypothetical protein O0L34_g8296 [Tuta absoluta]|nr:hypothetical protein O0L34_g8296 [Tuta absoluta]
MHLFIVSVLVAIAYARPYHYDPNDDDLHYNYYEPGIEKYEWGYQTNYIEHRQQGELKNRGTKNETLVVTGQFTWFDEEGSINQANYTADEKGFRIVYPKEGSWILSYHRDVVATLLGSG